MFLPGARRAAVAAAAFCLAALAGTALRRHTQRATLSLAEHDYTRIVEGTTVRIYKRTHASANALKDATWAMDNLGLSFLFNTTYTCSDDSPGDTAGGTPCAERMIVTGLADWDMHYYQSYITPMWNISVKDWADEWTASHFPGGADQTWNAWTPMGVTFYAPTLAPFLETWAAAGVASLRRKAGNLYSARVVVPHTGHVVEVVSNVTADAGSFGAYAADECGAASVPTRTVESLAKYWMAMGGELVNSAGLPDLLVVHVTQPVAERADVAKLGDFIATYSGASVDVAATVGDACGYGEFTLPLGPYENDFYVPFDYAVGIRSVWNPAMPLDRVKFYEHYMADAIDHLAGANQGFSRYMDWHVGLMMLASDGADTWTSLEANAAALEAAGVGFHDGGDGSEGSNWSRGASGLGVEFHGHYSRGGEGTLLGEYGNINYCAPHAYGADDLYCPADYDAMCDEAGC